MRFSIASARSLLSLDGDHADLGTRSADLAVGTPGGADASKIPPEPPRSISHSPNLKTAGHLDADTPPSIVQGAGEVF